MPSGAIYTPYTDYELGASRITEEAHCILGSIGKAKDSNEKYYEQAHINEEMDLILKTQQEWSKNTYITDTWDITSDKYRKKSPEDIRQASIILKGMAEENLQKLEYHKNTMDKHDYAIARKCYELLIALADEYYKSVDDTEKPKFNALATEEVRYRVNSLRWSVEDWNEEHGFK